MKSRMLKPTAVIVLFAFLLQGCPPIVKKYDIEYETVNTSNISEVESKKNLRTALEKTDPIDAESRHQVSVHLQSLKRVATGKIETEYEKSLAKQWTSLKPAEQKYALKRIAYFDAMPIYLQRKMVDKSYIETQLGTALLPQSGNVESAGAVCGASETQVCQGAGESGKLQMPEGSQGLALDPDRPLVGVAAGLSGLLLINVSSSSNPTYFPSSPYSSDDTGFVNDVLPLKVGSSAYMVITSSRTASKSGALEVIDITNPMAPISIVGKTIGDYYKLTLSADEAWAFSYNRGKNSIDVIDMTNLSSPNVVVSMPISGNLSDLSFVNSMLHLLMQDGSSVFYAFSVTGAPAIPGLSWVWGPDGFPCAGDTSMDTNAELLSKGNLSAIVRDRCVNIVQITGSGFPSDTGISSLNDDRHNTGTFIDDANIVIDMVHESQIRGTGDERIDCEVVDLNFLRIPEIGPAEPVVTSSVHLRNEVKGIAARDETIYLADHRSTAHCKSPGKEPVHFRVISAPKSVLAHREITPTIEAINGLAMYQSPTEMPRVMCGSQPVLCGFTGATGNECDPTGMCLGGVCAQPPVLEVSVDQVLNLTGTNYWDVDATVLIQNEGSTQWIPFDAFVRGDEFCELSDRMRVQLDNSVTRSGIKKIKIRNKNTEPKLRTCVNCQNLSDPTCQPDYVESKEIVVYLRNSADSTEAGYDLNLAEIQVKQGSNGGHDLGPNAWYDDETVVVLPDPDEGSATFLLPDDDGFEFQHNGEYENLGNLIAFRDTNASDAVTSPMIKLWETDDSTALGSALLGGGLSCAGIAWKTPVCGPYAPYCIGGCLSVAAVGALMLIFDGGDFIASETDMGLVLTKQIARDVLQFGRCALPSSWESNSSASTNRVLSVSDLIMIGGLKTRYITKEYVCKDCSKSTVDGNEWGGKYRLKFRLTERH